MKPNLYLCRRWLMPVIVLMFLFSSAYSQNCTSLNITYSVTESRCMATGTVTVNAGGGSGNYNYQLIGPTNIAFTSSNIITGLQAGSYKLVVKDIVRSCADTINNLVVAGSYSDPRFAISKTDITCMNAEDGIITVNNLQNGRGPFVYTIIAPSASGVGTSNTTGTFTQLKNGNYTIQLSDSCGGLQTRTTTVQNYTWSISSYTMVKTTCTNYNATINLLDSKGNTNNSGTTFNGFLYGVVNDPGDTSWFNTKSFLLDIGQKRNVTLVVKDGCGNVQSRLWINTAIPSVFANVTISGVSCAGFTATIAGQQNLTNPQYCLYNNVNALISCNTTGVFGTLPFGFYNIKITNTCYDTVITRYFNQTAPVPAVSGVVSVSNYNCTSVTATVTGQQNLTNPQYCLYENGITLIGCNSTGVFNNVPYGSHLIRVTDGCNGTVFNLNFNAIKRVRSVATNVTINGYTCTTFNATITGQSNLTNPTYCLYDNNDVLINCNSTGVFTGLNFGSYCIKVNDGCGDTTITRCINIIRPLPTIGATIISNRTCSGFTATVGGQLNIYNGLYCIKNDLGVIVACNASGVFNNLPFGTYCLEVTDGCTGNILTNCFTVVAPIPSVGSAIVSNITCAGFRVTQTGQTNLTNPQYCLLNNVGVQLVCNTTGVFDVTGFGTYTLQTTDGCTGVVFTRTVTIAKPVASVSTNVNFSNQNCNTFTASIAGQVNLTGALYNLRDNNNVVIASNATGVFNNLLYGSYCIDVRNSCMDTTITRCFTLAPNAVAVNVTATPSCVINAADIRVVVTSGFAPYTVQVYDQNNVLVNTTNSASSPINVTGLPTLSMGQTYRLVVSGQCGVPATQLVNAVPSTVNKSYQVIPKCPSGLWQNGSADLRASMSANLGAVSVSIIQKNFIPVSIAYSFNAGINFIFNDLEPATYVLRYTFSGCVQTLTDTVQIPVYSYPNLSKSAAYQCDNNSFSVGAAATGGVAPFTYEIIGSTPSFPSVIASPQVSPVFSINNGMQYSLVRLRVIDACGNATLNDASILPLANTIITASSNCFNNDITLSVDTIPNANYIWYRKINATDSVLIGSGNQFNIPFLQPTDTGTYVCKMSVNAGCLTKLSYFNVNGVCGFGVLPAHVTLTAKSMNTSNQLNWVASNEGVTRRYVVERSGTGSSDFIAIGNVLAIGSGNKNYYAFADNQILSGSNFYRLRIEDADGKFKYSNVVKLSPHAKNEISVYPNPVITDFTISISSNLKQDYMLQLYNASGQLIFNNRQVNIQSAAIKYQRSEQNKSGMYLLKVINTTTGESTTQKLIFK